MLSVEWWRILFWNLQKLWLTGISIRMRQRLEEIHEEKIGYPFAIVLRMRVVQVVCGISTVLMGAVALIEEKSLTNLGLGVPAGIATVLAASNNIYFSRGFDGYQPSSCQATPWLKLRVFGSTFKQATINIVLWSLAVALEVCLTIKVVHVLSGSEFWSVTIIALAGTELLLSICVLVMLVGVTWVDCIYDPDWQEPPDLAYSNTGTAVSMVALSQSAAPV